MRGRIRDRNAAFPAAAGEVVVFVHTHVREDAIVLFGFASEDERLVFEVLLATHGGGTSLALAILGTLGSDAVIRAVQSGDAAAFEAVSGVGKKTAARLVLELHGSLADVRGAPGPVRSAPEGDDERADVAAALGELGYSADEIRRAVSTLDGTEPIESALRLALRELSRR